jgi:lipoprotein-anchoring transpeptidase ErfK/SrfK
MLFQSIYHKTLLFLTIPIILIGLLQCTPQENPDMPQQPPDKSAETLKTLPEPQHNQIDSSLLSKELTQITPAVEEEKNDVPMLLDKATIIVDISEQTLYLYQGNQAVTEQLVKTYPISTSKYGIGNKTGTGKTPLGKHYIKNKIGDGAPERMIFKGRQSTGQLAEINQEGVGDLVTTRIMWLKGLEPGINSGRGIDSYQRYIYIHGTAEENKIGQPASHGCVRMYNRDVIDLFERVREGTPVEIIK